jgi:hypothetical protein
MSDRRPLIVDDGHLRMQEAAVILVYLDTRLKKITIQGPAMHLQQHIFHTPCSNRNDTHSACGGVVQSAAGKFLPGKKYGIRDEDFGSSGVDCSVR